MRKSVIIAFGFLAVILSGGNVRADGDETLVVAATYLKQANFTVRSEPQYVAASSYSVAVPNYRVIDFPQCMAERADLQGEVSGLQEQVQGLEDRIERICEERCSRARHHDSCMSDCRS